MALNGAMITVRPEPMLFKHPIRIMLVDDSQTVVEALGRWMKYTEGVEMVGAARSMKRAVEQASVLKPDVVLLDAKVPGNMDFDPVAMIKARDPNVRVVLMSHYPFSVDRMETHEGIDASIAKTELVRQLVPTLEKIVPSRGLAGYL